MSSGIPIVPRGIYTNKKDNRLIVTVDYGTHIKHLIDYDYWISNYKPQSDTLPMERDFDFIAYRIKFTTQSYILKELEKANKNLIHAESYLINSDINYIPDSINVAIHSDYEFRLEERKKERDRIFEFVRSNGFTELSY